MLTKIKGDLKVFIPKAAVFLKDFISKAAVFLKDFISKAAVFLKDFLSTTKGVLTASVVVAFILFFIGFNTSGVVYIRDGDNTCVVKFSDLFNNLEKLSVERILDKADISVSEHDEVFYSGFLGQYAEVNIKRAFEVSVTHDGITEKIYPTQATVREAIEGLGVEIGEYDITTMPLFADTKEGDEITLKRVHYVVETVEEEIPFKQVSKKSSLLKNGRTRVVTAGVNGLKDVSTKEMYVDGELYKTDIVEEVVTLEPVNELSIEGARVAISPRVYEEYPLDENGLPIKFERIMRQQKCAAYWAKPGAGMASGGKAVVGRVAVDPRIIPYGTKMYIVSSDSESFIYGYCEAGDTGIALVEGLITIDIFFATKKEAQIFGIKWLDIYILEWGE